jgi:hypothetical protein
VRILEIPEFDWAVLERRVRDRGARARDAQRARTTVTDELRDEILTATLTLPPAGLGITHWSSRLLAEWLRRRGTRVSHDSISRLWRRFGIQPWRCETFKFSTDPELEAKIRDVVGLYLNPPENAIVLSTGKLADACYPRHRHQEFLKFLKQVAKAYPRQKLHLVCETTPPTNISTSKPGWSATRGSLCTSPRPQDPG